ncbi:Protein of unknown function, partial [Gryllus bimaculatus]
IKTEEVRGSGEELDLNSSPRGEEGRSDREFSGRNEEVPVPGLPEHEVITSPDRCPQGSVYINGVCRPLTRGTTRC